MRQNIKKFLIFWSFIGMLGLELSLICSSVDPNLYPVLYSFLLVFPFVFISSFLTLYVGYQIPKWAVKYKDWKSKIKGLTITCYILIALIGIIPVVITMIVIGVQNIPMASNGNIWPFNAIGLIAFYILYNFLNIGFLIYTHKPEKLTRKHVKKEKTHG